MFAVQRYLFRELLMPVVAATAALTGVAVLSGSLQLLTVVVSQRQAAWTFLELVALTVPNLIAFVLPISAFVATLFTVNKLHTEQEIVVCFAAGMNRWQVAAPLMRLCAWAGMAMLVISLWIAPLCQRVSRELLFKIRTDVVGSLVKEGQFVESPGGLTVYAQRVDADNELHNLFLHQLRADHGSATYDAKSGVIVHRNGAPVLVMRDGSNEQFTPEGTLNYLKFDEYTLDLSPYVSTDQLAYKPSDMYLHELVFPDRHAGLNKVLRKKMTAEWNARLSAPIYLFLFVLVALNAVLGGSFSRLGYARRIGIAALGALLARLLGVTVNALAEATPALNVLQWLVPLAPCWFAARTLFGAPRTPKAKAAGAPIGRVASGGGLQALGA
jgi:lipopolysaccharide export system permease protein